MFDDTTSKDDHSRFLCPQCSIIQQSDILYQVHDKARVLVRIEEDDVTKGSICKGRAKDRDVILPAPIVDAIFIIDLLSHTGDDLLRRENLTFLLLLLVHLLHHRLKPFLQKLIVLVWNYEVSNSVKTFLSQLLSLK